MKKGLLVVNAYLRSEKFHEIYQYLISAAEKEGMILKIVTNKDVLTDCDSVIMDEPEFVIFWDKDIKAAMLLESKGIRLFNCSAAIEACDNKALTYIKLLREEVKMPKTIISPLTYGLEDKSEELAVIAERKLGYPFVIKESFGSFGAQVYLANDQEEAIEILDMVKGKEFIIQEFIESSKGRDIRINMVGNKAVTAMLRRNEGDFRANITNGGTMTAYEPTSQQIDIAVKACEALKLDFAGVDLLFGEDEEPILCEVNSNAHFKNIFECTGVNVAECIMSYIKECLQ